MIIIPQDLLFLEKFLDYPHTVNVRSITLTGNYKWMPESDVEFLRDRGARERSNNTITK